MKKGKFLIVFVTVLGLGTIGFGQECPPGKKEHKKLTPTERAEKKTERMTKELGLSEEQAAKIKEINASHFAEMEKHREAIKVSRDQHKAEMDAVLTPEQKEKLESLREEKKAKMKARKEGANSKRE